MKAWAIVAVVAIGAVAAVTIGQVERDRVPALDALPGWAGGRADVAACERYIGTTLTAPSTYRRIEIAHLDSDTLTQAAFDREAGIVAPPKSSRRAKDKLDEALAERERLDAMMLDLERQRAEGHDLRLRQLAINYDADNSFGVPTRGAAICKFRLIDGQLDSEAELMRRAERSTEAIDAAMAYLGRKSIRQQKPAGCCL